MRWLVNRIQLIQKSMQIEHDSTMMDKPSGSGQKHIKVESRCRLPTLSARNKVMASWYKPSPVLHPTYVQVEEFLSDMRIDQTEISRDL